MEDSIRSGGVVKKKSSSGCLIIKKKDGGAGGGLGVMGVGSSKRGSGYKDKKRPRLIMSDSGSSDESLEGLRRRATEKFHNGGVGYRRSGGEEKAFGRNGGFDERKRTKMDLFEFDEYDEFEGKNVRDEYVNDRLNMVGRGGGSRDFGSGGSRRDIMVEKRKHSFSDGLSVVPSGRSKGVEYGGKNKFELDEDEAHLPISLLRLKYQEVPDEPIRFQGKNGVLKVMVNKKKKMDMLRDNYDAEEVENRKASRSQDVVKKEIDLRPQFYSESKRMDKRISFVEREKNETKIRKPYLGKSAKAEDLEIDETDTSLKLAPPSLPARSSSKGLKKEERRSPTEKFNFAKGKEEKKSPTESITPVRTKEEKKVSHESITPMRGREGGKLKRGGSTEKQQLRERIREMLMKAGWNIDYRPRRNRDYLDAVYINPSGTAYWSIIKAYDALQKQLKDQQGKNKSDGVSSFAPLSEDLISKLTRQTRKKIEEEMKKKRKEDGMIKNAKRAAAKESANGSDSDQNEETLRSYMRQNRKTLKEKLHESDHESGDESSDTSCKRTPRDDRVEKSSDAGNNNVVQARRSRIIGRCTLLVRNSDMGENSESDGYVPYTGKRTVLAWLIDSGTVQLSEKVQYMSRRRTRVKLEGWITRDGIHCGCCSKILTVSKFELHAGSKLRQPFQNIYLESGVSLLQCQIDAWNRQEKSERQDFYTIDVDGDDPDDDTCGICGDGGDLICCDSCPSTFHQSCLEIKMLPPGDWHCPNCVCKFCGTARGNVAEEDNSSGAELMMCSLCERKYHKLCSEEIDVPPVNSNNGAAYFCGRKCQELYDHLQKILGVKNELEAGFSWSLVHRTDIDSDISHRGYAQRVESNSKLAVALSVMDECFLPIVDRRSGISLIHNVLYNCGANFSRLNYRGFYTGILERGDEIISVASIRIHGTQLAEMPFIGTRHIYRRQGMCRRLLSAIELELASLKVERLIIPAISEHLHTWTLVFGFNSLEESLKKEMKSMNMLVFPGTDMLRKQLGKQAMHNGIKAGESKDIQSPDLLKKSGMDSSVEHDGDDVCDDAKGQDEKVNKVDPMDSDSPDSAAPNSISSPVLGSALESDIQHSSKETGLVQSKPVAECTSSMKSSSPLAASTSLHNMENSSQDPLVEDSTQTVSEANTGDSHKGPVESSRKNFPEEANDNRNSGIDGSSVQLKPELNRCNLVDTQSNLCVSSDVASDAEVNANPAPREVNMKDYEPMLGPSLETAESITEKVNGEMNCPSVSDPCSGRKPSLRLNSDLNEPSATNGEEPNVPSEPVSNAKADVDEVTNGEGNMSALSEVGDDNTSPVEACNKHS